ncbi:MAG: aminotransferase class I/II-fold pyridoxal phosphate-dependent enzyme, partial [Candidatus Eremiobacteraeota bacterium]|nr:aminotransferase class I/II-fold pyridoxal phosphate-dependent enzyme [Candidatus Eremiobacteraeota bacterium]
MTLPASVVLRLPTLTKIVDHLLEQQSSDEPASVEATPQTDWAPPTDPVRPAPPAGGNGSAHHRPSPPLEHWLADVATYDLYEAVDGAAQELGLDSPFFREHAALAGATSEVHGRQMINYASYNYLGLSGHPEVSQAAVQAIERYGTSVSASRMVGGERPVHRELEQALAAFLGTEDCLLMVSGHATNVTTLAHLMGPGDLLLHDALAHDSAVQGASASRATVKGFSHNDLDDLERLLIELRPGFERILVYVEGLYSMDGDYPDLARLTALKERFHFLLMVDEAHSVGVLGATGRGLAEHLGIDRNDPWVLWMGTLSKALASCGGFLAGSRKLIRFLRHTLPGFVYSVGM